MALTVKHLLDTMKQTLGGSWPSDVQPLDVLNQSGEHLHSMHPWRWAQGRTTLLNLRGTVSGTTAAWTTGVGRAARSSR